MGSTSPPESPPSKAKTPPPSSSSSQQQAESAAAATANDVVAAVVDDDERQASVGVSELSRLLELRDQEIRALKFELEKYKLALHQSQLDYHYIQQQVSHNQSNSDDRLADESLDSRLLEASQRERLSLGELGTLLGDDDQDEPVEEDRIMSSEARVKRDTIKVVAATSRPGTNDNNNTDNQGDERVAKLRRDRRTGSVCDENIVAVESSSARDARKMLGRQSTASASSTASTSRIMFKTGDDEDSGRVESDQFQEIVDDGTKANSDAEEEEEVDDDDDDELEELIHDVGEIDLNLELDVSASTKRESKFGRSKAGILGNVKQATTTSTATTTTTTTGRGTASSTATADEELDEDEDGISEGLLTSLTDAAISNLSQLAALQERCESQQHSHSYQQQSQQQPQQRSQSQPQQMASQSAAAATACGSKTAPGGTLATSSPAQLAGGPIRVMSPQSASGSEFAHDPFSTSSIANQAAIAINAAAAAAAVSAIQPSQAGLLVHTQHHQPTSSSSSSSILPNSTIQADLASTNTNQHQSLASVVAAAAVAAAAAANDQQDHQQQHHHHHQHPHHHHHQQQQQQQQRQQQQHPHQSQLGPHAHSPTPTRLISSALPSPEFYHSLHQHHQQQQQHAVAAAAAAHAQALQQQQHHHSPSSLHFSPSTSVTPSPSSLIAQSRRSISNASSSLMSPISSPNYLRRQFMPDRLPLLSPSPTSGLTTGSSSGTSSSLAHLLHHQQRSASALGGSGTGSGGTGSALGASIMTPASSTPLSSSGSTAVSPLMSNKNSSQARLNNMQIRHKFGYLGSGRAQFNSPHGFCLGLNQEIVVADTNNHRVCIFDKSGTYITQFGSPGKEEGQLWNPRKVAILHRPIVGSQTGANSASSTASSTSQATSHPLQASHHHPSLHQLHQHQHHNQASSPYSNQLNSSSSSLQNSGQLLSGNSEPLYVVCDRGAERSRMQLFTKDGAFIKKIGIHYIDIVAGLAITQNGLIIVVDSVSPTVYIINGETGILNGWFDCSGHMKEPSDIAVKSDVPGNEYFICDFKGHCVVVFSEQGEYLRKIGHDGLTSYPNGIDISDDGDILVGDSHGNRFHVVVFDRNGNFVSQFECPHVKVSRCCGLKITREGYIVTLAKNNHHVLVLDTIHI